MRRAIFSVVTILLFALPALAAKDSPSAKFIEEAMQGNLWEVQAGQLARAQASDAEVRKFGAMLNMEHGAATSKAATAAQSLGVTPPTELTAKHKAKYERLKSLSGPEFDRRFIAEMVQDHREDIAKHEKQAASGNDAAAAYAKDVLPALRRHLQEVEGLQKKQDQAKTAADTQ